MYLLIHHRILVKGSFFFVMSSSIEVGLSFTHGGDDFTFPGRATVPKTGLATCAASREERPPGTKSKMQLPDPVTMNRTTD